MQTVQLKICRGYKSTTGSSLPLVVIISKTIGNLFCAVNKVELNSKIKWCFKIILHYWSWVAHYRWQRRIFGIPRRTEYQTKRSESELATQYRWQKTPLAWTCDTNGTPVQTSTGVALEV